MYVIATWRSPYRLVVKRKKNLLYFILTLEYSTIVLYLLLFYYLAPAARLTIQLLRLNC